MKRRIHQNFIFFIITAVSLASCTTAEYIQHTPTLANSGQPTGKGEFSGRAMYSKAGS